MRRRITLGVLTAGLLWAATGSAQTYICLGDSITFGDGTQAGSYLGPLAGFLRSIVQSPTLINSGVPFNTTADVRSRLASVLASPSSHVLLMIGTNDVSGWAGGWLTMTDTDTNLRSIIASIQGAGRIAVLATVVPRRGNDSVDASNIRTNQLNNLIRTVASSTGTTLAEVNGYLQSVVSSDYAYDDSIHPSRYALPLVAEAFGTAITGRTNIDLTAPIPWFITPRPSATNVPLSSNIDIALGDPGAGIDSARATMVIDGVAVFPEIRLQSGLTHFVYQPPVPFRFGQGVSVSLTVGDFNLTPNVTNLSYSFVATGGNGTSGDLDRSGRIDGHDLAILASAFGAGSGQSRFLPEADVDGSGFVDGLDLVFIATGFGGAP